jgi:hypothetical protein
MRITTTSKFAIAAALSLAIGAVQPAAAQNTRIAIAAAPIAPRAVSIINPDSMMPTISRTLSASLALPHMRGTSVAGTLPVSLGGDGSEPVALLWAYRFGETGTSGLNPDSMMPTAIVVDPKTGTSVLNPDSMMPGTMVPPSVHASSSNHESSDEDLVGLLPFFDEGHVTGSDPTPHP